MVYGACSTEPLRTGMRISSPGTQFFREIAFFSFSISPPLFPLIQGKNGVIWGGDKIIIPGWSTYYIKHKYTIRSGLWAVIFSHFYSTLFYLIQSAVVAVAVAFSLYRITELLSRIKYENQGIFYSCLLYTSPSPRDKRQSRMPSSA